MDSPKARPPGDFNWGATLWHEMAHVITLQLSNQRLPRWLSEGISVFEEKRARPEWGREMEVPSRARWRTGEAIKLRELNAGFQNPETISLAYYEASLLVEHIVEKHGEPALRALVKSFADGIDTEKRHQESALERHRRAAGHVRRVSRPNGSRACAARSTPPKGLTPDQPIEKLKAAAADASRELRRADGARPSAASDRIGRAQLRRSSGPSSWRR